MTSNKDIVWMIFARFCAQIIRCTPGSWLTELSFASNGDLRTFTNTPCTRSRQSVKVRCHISRQSTYGRGNFADYERRKMESQHEEAYSTVCKKIFQKRAGKSASSSETHQAAQPKKTDRYTDLKFHKDGRVCKRIACLDNDVESIANVPTVFTILAPTRLCCRSKVGSVSICNIMLLEKAVCSRNFLVFILQVCMNASV
jgi:hypothetical protein